MGTVFMITIAVLAVMLVSTLIILTVKTCKYNELEAKYDGLFDNVNSCEKKISDLCFDLEATEEERDKLLKEVEKARVFNSYLLGYYRTLSDSEFKESFQYTEPQED